MAMSRVLRTADYAATLEQTVKLGDCVPADHLARFIADVITQLDFTPFYRRYGPRGGAASAPELLFGRLVSGYATGVFSRRKLERATDAAAPVRLLAGNQHPDHDTIATFRATFLAEVQGLFVQVLLLAQEIGLLTLGNISLDGTKLHADAAKSKAVRYQRLGDLEARLRAEVAELFALAEQADPGRQPAGLVVADEITRRQDRLARLAAAKAVLEARAQERDAAEQAAEQAKLREREATARRTGRPPRGRPPQPPTPGPRPTDQYNFTDPDSRIMKNSTHAGFEQDYNAQVAVEHGSRLIVGQSRSNHPTDHGEAVPTVAAIPPALGTPPGAALDTGYFSQATVEALAARGIAPSIATGREPHHQSWQTYFAAHPAPLAAEAGVRERMADTLKTATGKAIDRLRTCTVEPVIGSIKETLGFRQFSLRGLTAAAGEWGVVCLAYNLKRLPVLGLG